MTKILPFNLCFPTPNENHFSRPPARNLAQTNGLTNIYEDWSKELEYANKQQYDFYWPSPVKPGGDHFDYEYENKLVEDWGIPKDFVIYRMWTATKKECPILCGLADKLGLEDAQVNIQTQTTGMMLHLHIDSLTGLRKERKDQYFT